MERTRKLMLVDPTNLDVRNTKRHYSALDRNISDVLNKDGVDDSEKLRLYQYALNKFLINKQSLENELSEPLKVDAVSNRDTADKNEQVAQLVSEIIARFGAPAAAAVPTAGTTTTAAPSTTAAVAAAPSATTTAALEEEPALSTSPVPKSIRGRQLQTKRRDRKGIQNKRKSSSIWVYY